MGERLGRHRFQGIIRGFPIQEKARITLVGTVVFEMDRIGALVEANPCAGFRFPSGEQGLQNGFPIDVEFDGAIDFGLKMVIVPQIDMDESVPNRMKGLRGQKGVGSLILRRVQGDPGQHGGMPGRAGGSRLESNEDTRSRFRRRFLRREGCAHREQA